MGCLLTFTDSRQQIFRQFVNPDDHIQSTWDDTYNSALIRRLLSRTPLVGGIDLTPRELMDYGTGAWYFEKRDPRQIGFNAVCDTEKKQQEFDAAVARAREEGVLPRYIHFDESNVTLWGYTAPALSQQLSDRTLNSLVWMVGRGHGAGGSGGILSAAVCLYS